MTQTQGFTLIELLIVIAIIGILAAVLIPNLLTSQRRAYDAGAQACGKSLQTALSTWYIDESTYIGATVNKNMEGAAAACTNATVGTATLSQDAYSFTVRDLRGKRIFIVTPTNIVGS